MPLPLPENLLKTDTPSALPADFRVRRELGRGANNRVFLVDWEGEARVLRVPRRGSDTQSAGSCKWEFLHTMRASELGVAPAIHAAWYARHSKQGWPSGLYFVMDHFKEDMHTFLRETRDPEERTSVADGIVRALSTLAADRMLLFDLKASNVVLRPDGEGGVDVRLIDYGRDFCEWRSPLSEQEVDVRTPTIDLLHRLAAERAEAATGLVEHVLFATMLVQISATTGRHLYEDRHDTKMNRTEREAANPLTKVTKSFLSTMQGRNVALVRALLRSDDVRSVLRHYHGRHNSGTGRTFGFAVGREK